MDMRVGVRPAVSGEPSGEPSGVSPEPVLGLVGGDLMVRSRIESVANRVGWRMRDLRTPQDAAGCTLVVVDLNRDREQRLHRLHEVAVEVPGATVLAFGPHLDVAAWRPAARRAGAGTCTVNSRVERVLLDRLSKLAADGGEQG